MSSRLRTFCVGLAFLIVLPALTQALADAPSQLLRRYLEGEKLAYLMKGTNEAWHYQIRADGIVKKDAAGYFEEYQWSNLISDGQPVALSPATAGFRQQVTLDTNHNLGLADLSKADPRLIGPITDFLTFYVDLWIAKKAAHLSEPGDHFYFKRGIPNSWADGSYTSLGEDSIDFDFTLKQIDRTANTAILLVRHVPPEKPQIKLPADWMQNPVTDAPNNWVQVQVRPGGKFLAAVGKETFDVAIQVSLLDGKILSGTIENPLETIERECTDVALTQCGDPRPRPIHRHIEISLAP
jgi:hypothetical protein